MVPRTEPNVLGVAVRRTPLAFARGPHRLGLPPASSLLPPAFPHAHRHLERQLDPRPRGRRSAVGAARHREVADELSQNRRGVRRRHAFHAHAKHAVGHQERVALELPARRREERDDVSRDDVRSGSRCGARGRGSECVGTAAAVAGRHRYRERDESADAHGEVHGVWPKWRMRRTIALSRANEHDSALDGAAPTPRRWRINFMIYP